jgi:ferritin
MQLKSFLTPLTTEILEQAIEQELHASHLYRHLANQCQRLGLFGAQKYFKAESADELTHYERIVDFINDRGSVAETPTIESIATEVTSLKDALEAGYEAEVALGAKYADWYKKTVTVEPITGQFLLQFLEIQNKSIGEYADLLQRLDLGGDILVFDNELGSK